MIRSYIKVAVRIFGRDRLYSLVNLSGLALGLASVILIFAYIGYELSFDRHFSKSEQIYQLVLEDRQRDPIQQTVMVPDLLGKTLVQEFPEIEASTLLSPSESNFLHNDLPIQLKTLLVSPNFFEIFDIPVLQGNKSTFLNEKFALVITSGAASKLFPQQDPVGKIISQKSWNGDLISFTVTGVISDIPANTHFSADAIVSLPAISGNLNFKGYSARPQYVMFKPAIGPDNLKHKILSTLKKYNLNKNASIRFLPLADVHLKSRSVASSNFKLGDIRYIYIFGSVAFLILFIGCINYINLTTAQALKRIKEVGIRKTLGSARRQLAFQFIGESLLFFSIAAVLAVMVALAALPKFGNVLQVRLVASDLFRFQNVVIFLSVALLSGICSGSYPAFILSKMKPSGIFKDSKGAFKLSFTPRKVLIVFQFSISMTLIIATIVIWQQLDLFKNQPLGFEKDHLLVLPAIDMGSAHRAFKTTLLENPNILSASVATLDLGGGIYNSSSMSDPADSRRKLDFAFVGGDFDFLETMGIKIKTGRNFSEKNRSDITNYDSLYSDALKNKEVEKATEYNSKSPIIVTENLIKTLKLKNPINEVLELPALQGRVIGIVNNFQITNLKEQSPLLVYQLKTDGSNASTYIRLNNQNIPRSIEHIAKIWKKFFPSQPFKYSFADDNLQRWYVSESRLTAIFGSFAVFAIGISALGLFGFVALAVRQRTKEIGVRKVMGASLSGIVLLLSKDFVSLIVLSGIIASPIAWYGMNKWLKDFAIHIEIQWWIFAIAGGLVLLTGVLTVCFQTIKAAKMNPVDSLKTE